MCCALEKRAKTQTFGMRKKKYFHSLPLRKIGARKPSVSRRFSGDESKPFSIISRSVENERKTELLDASTTA